MIQQKKMRVYCRFDTLKNHFNIFEALEECDSYDIMQDVVDCKIRIIAYEMRDYDGAFDYCQSITDADLRNDCLSKLENERNKIEEEYH